MADCVVLGVVEGTMQAPRVSYLERLLPATAEVLALSGPVSPTRVFRFAAPCAAHACPHFDGAICRLGTKIVEALPEVGGVLPICPLRPQCRWWRQAGRAACLRCPQVVTEVGNPTEEQVLIADPAVLPGGVTPQERRLEHDG
jgi:hypothetical protein